MDLLELLQKAESKETKLTANPFVDENRSTLLYTSYTELMDELWYFFNEKGYSQEASLAGAASIGDAIDEIKIETATSAEMALLLFQLRRGERFCAGMWRSMIENGNFSKIYKRILELDA